MYACHPVPFFLFSGLNSTRRNVRIFWMPMDGSPDSLQTVTTQVQVLKPHLGHIFKMATRCISPLWF
jgi:hypothetical protein